MPDGTAARASPADGDGPATRPPAVAAEQVLELDARRVLAGLGSGWPLTAREVEGLVPAVRAALATGWSVAQLAATLSRDAGRVRSPAAVLRTRLNAVRPKDAADTSRRPPWCGDDRCDPDTRHRERDDSAVYRCPVCHPLASHRRP